MKTSLPHIGNTNVCMDDSCDGSHCRVCGCHFLDWYNGGPICEKCLELDVDKQIEVIKFIKYALEM